MTIARRDLSLVVLCTIAGFLGGVFSHVILYPARNNASLAGSSAASLPAVTHSDKEAQKAEQRRVLTEQLMSDRTSLLEIKQKLLGDGDDEAAANIDADKAANMARRVEQDISAIRELDRQK
jgi:hypothetical protein